MMNHSLWRGIALPGFRPYLPSHWDHRFPLRAESESMDILKGGSWYQLTSPAFMDDLIIWSSFAPRFACPCQLLLRFKSNLLILLCSL